VNHSSLLNQIIHIYPEIDSIFINSNIYSFEQNCFAGFKMKFLSLLNSITSFSEYYFQKCSSLIQISLPNSITLLGDYSFQECSSLTLLNYPSSL
jgi:hypothetical protein